jgi:hypothetical protein
MHWFRIALVSDSTGEGSGPRNPSVEARTLEARILLEAVERGADPRSRGHPVRDGPASPQALGTLVLAIRHTTYPSTRLKSFSAWARGGGNSGPGLDFRIFSQKRIFVFFPKTHFPPKIDHGSVDLSALRSSYGWRRIPRVALLSARSYGWSPVFWANGEVLRWSTGPVGGSLPDQDTSGND